MIRHKEKDEEAGGEGLGRLQTRKRLWRDSTGAVVAKRRPEHEKKRSNSSSSPKVSKTERRVMSPDGHVDVVRPDNEPLSPPKSLDHGRIEDDVMDHSQVPHISASADDLWPMPSSVDEAGLQAQAPPMESFDFLCNASWGTQPPEANNSDLLYNDLFAPDTGMFPEISAAGMTLTVP